MCRPCSMQTRLQRAGSFNPCAVAEALEGFEFDGLGNGKTLYRAEDHQCFKDVLVVKGKENPTSEFDLLEIVEVTPREQVDLCARPSACLPVANSAPATRAHKPAAPFGAPELPGGGRMSMPPPHVAASPQWGELQTIHSHCGVGTNGRNNPSNPQRARQGLGLCADRAGSDAYFRHAWALSTSPMARCS